MEPYNLLELGTHLEAWKQMRLLAPVLSIEGGWESWLQVDFPVWLDVAFATQYDFRREVQEQGKRLDWIINSTTGRAAVEIKAQTHKFPNSAFLAAVQGDVGKLAQLAGFDHKLMLAAVIDDGLKDTLVHEGFVVLTPPPHPATPFQDVNFLAFEVDP